MACWSSLEDPLAPDCALNLDVVLQAVAILLPWALLLALLVSIAKSRVGRAVRRFLTPRAREGSES